ncbi:MAG: TerB family tellurite resistance protein [Mariprofundaceae bacterium]|nr:TerB family tellurite resistance protein [Mariprofundaceae bacterium]
MSWLGAGIGAGIGAVIGGPIGAGIGAWIGSSVTRTSSRVMHAGPASMGQEEAQSLFFVALFSMLAKMAKADGRVAPEEADLINNLARTHIKMDAEDRKAAGLIFKNALDDEYSIYDYAGQYMRVAGTPSMCEMVYRLLFAVAYADEELHPDEDAILRELPAYLGLDPLQYRIFKDEFQGQQVDIGESYKVLGCEQDSSDTEVKRAYRKLCMEYHPDKIASKGLPEGFMAYAEQQMHQINEAYETIMKKRA